MVAQSITIQPGQNIQYIQLKAVYRALKLRGRFQTAWARSDWGPETQVSAISWPTPYSPENHLMCAGHYFPQRTTIDDPL